jgi:tubulin epsilon
VQIGWRFWDLVLREHARASASGLFDDSMSSFFRNVDTRYEVPRDIPLVRGGDSRNPIRALKARAILIDMEEGVVSQVCRASCIVHRASCIVHRASCIVHRASHYPVLR